ncbi:MAG: alpha/beta fold hydrolase [Ottowia sp.]|uniref:alpha/beta fold hydrolase n=1 Tax=Ottowia sp. TaxID=1898956 RepID=UPI003C73120C
MNFSRLSAKACKALACTTIVAALGACGGDGDPDPLQKYREQTVQWTECDSTIFGSSSAALHELTTAAGDRLRCGFVRAPLDWSNTERGDIVVSVMRLAAGKPGQRRGALLFNPGGPGVDGLSTTFALFGAFYKSNPESPQGARQLRLLDEYDMVGFSPRGTGASTQLQCGTNEVERSLLTSAAEWDTPENIANANYNGSKTAEACQKNPIAPYINTDATARDVDLIRGLLGDDKLNYVGYSYGTWLGAWYASLFPEKVGRMVLDSSTDFSSTLEQTVLLAQPPARQRLLDDVIVPYAVRHADYFRLGTTAAEVQSIMPGLSHRVQQVLSEPISSYGYQRTDADKYLEAIAAARGLDTVLKAMADPADMEAVDEALDEYVFDPSNQKRNTDIRAAAEKLQQSYAAHWVHPQPRSIALDSSNAVLTAVHCNDTAATTDLTAWASLVRGLAQRAPMFFSGLLGVHTCAFWGGPKVSKPDLVPMKPLDILFVQSQYDAATNTDGANAFFAQLPGARRVYVQGEYQHGVYPYTDSCVDPLVTNYLLGDTLSEREATCPTHPLAQDAPSGDQASSAEQKAASAAEPAGSAPPVYKDPKEASELIDEFKRGLIPPNLRQ